MVPKLFVVARSNYLEGRRCWESGEHLAHVGSFSREFVQGQERADRESPFA